MKNILKNLGVIEYLLLSGILAILIVCICRQSFFVKSTIMGASLIGLLLSAFIASYGLKRKGLGLSRIPFVVIAVASSLWLYEIIYHYAFFKPEIYNHLINDVTYLGTDISETHFPLIWATAMIVIFFAGYKFIHFGKAFYITLSLAIIFFLFWRCIGYPQWVHPEYFPMTKVLIPIIPSEYYKAPNTDARDYITNVSLIINSITKIPVAILLPSLFLGKNKVENEGIKHAD